MREELTIPKITPEAIEICLLPSSNSIFVKEKV
jgi:hypothetical protein